MRNLEFKARLKDANAALTAALSLGAKLGGDLRQTDTYFRAPNGRLKLRETPASPAELIFYDRDEGALDRPSDYLIVRSTEGAELAALLRQALGVSSVVRKQRTLLLLDTTRIHLDNVDTLGSFIEIEVPVTDDEAAARERLEVLIQALSLDWADCIHTSYADLIAAQQT